MNEYERLTNSNIKEHNPKHDFCMGCKHYESKYYACSNPNGTCAKYKHFINEIYNRLAELEDKIENKTLIDLPCKVGDELFIIAKFVNSGEWFLLNDYSVGDFIVTTIYLNLNKEIKLKINSYTIKLSDFGKTVFLTKAEAEAKLRELKGGIEK